MNYRPFTPIHAPGVAQPQWLQHFAQPQWLPRKACHGLLLLLTCLLLAGCWGDEATPEATGQPAAEAPVSALPTGEITDTAVPTDTATAETAATTPEGIAALATTSAEASATTTTTAPTATFVPLEAEENGDCAVESSLDLAGYPDLEQRLGCAIEPATNDPVAINEFGDADQPTNRFMLWFSQEQAIYVLLPDGTYQVHEDTWVEDVDPTYPCNPLGVEEDSPPLPRRGFGKLWCSSPELQAILGTVPREERLCQYAVLQRFETGRLLACFEDATIRYFRILDDGKWDLQMQ